MGLFRPDRDRRDDDDPFLLWKVRLFVIGAGLGFAGMMLEMPVLLWLGIGALFVGVALRFRRPAAPPSWDMDEGEEE